jgi:hypothetical protein
LSSRDNLLKASAGVHGVVVDLALQDASSKLGSGTSFCRLDVLLLLLAESFGCQNLSRNFSDPEEHPDFERSLSAQDVFTASFEEAIP